ncbi:hypothetical protein [Streptomyces sp. NPDC058861]|uniref:hypothetical protein n=1 Tax=Streptomyces sp. NPDC058861 TaxID=3346653 RepID=UPI0036B64D17
MIDSRISAPEFALRARSLLSSLRSSFVVDEDLANDLDAVLGSSGAPEGLAGAKRYRGRAKGFLGRRTKPSSHRVAEVGRDITRLERMLGQLVTTAQVWEWEPPYPNVADAIAQAEAVRGQQAGPTGKFGADLAHLRRLARVTDELLGRLAVEEEDA